MEWAFLRRRLRPPPPTPPTPPPPPSTPPPPRRRRRHAFAAYAAAAYAAAADYATNAHAPAWDAACTAELRRLVGVVADALPGCRRGDRVSIAPLLATAHCPADALGEHLRTTCRICRGLGVAVHHTAKRDRATCSDCGTQWARRVERPRALARETCGARCAHAHPRDRPRPGLAAAWSDESLEAAVRSERNAHYARRAEAPRRDACAGQRGRSPNSSALGRARAPRTGRQRTRKPRRGDRVRVHALRAGRLGRGDRRASPHHRAGGRAQGAGARRTAPVATILGNAILGAAVAA